MSEQELLRAARAGDADAYRDLVAPYISRMRAQCGRILGSWDDADDAVQDALLSAWRGLARFEGRCPVAAWLHRIATNCALNGVARRRGLTVVDTEQADDERAESAGESVELREDLERALLVAHERLPARQRAVLILRDALDFSAREAATSLETTTAAVNSALLRARAAVASTPEDAMPRPATLADARLRRRVRRYVDVWDRDDVNGVLALLLEDAA